MLHRCIGPGEEETLVTVVAPSDCVRRRTVDAADLEDLGISIGVPEVATLDDDSITDVPTSGHGLQNMADRAARLGGTFAISEKDGSGTVLEWSVPNAIA